MSESVTFPSKSHSKKDQFFRLGLSQSKRHDKIEADLLAKYVLSQDPSTEGSLHVDVGIDLAKYGLAASKIAQASYIGAAAAAASITGVGAALMIASGIVFITVGALELYRESSDLSHSQDTTPFNLIDPKDLTFSDLSQDTRPRERYRLLGDKLDFDDLKRDLDSVKSELDRESDDAQMEKQSRVGALSEREVTSLGREYTTETMSEY